MYDVKSNTSALKTWGENLYNKYTSVFVNEILNSDGDLNDKAVSIANSLIKRGLFEGDDPDIIKACEYGLLIAYEK
jgi:hypothetical protein